MMMKRRKPQVRLKMSDTGIKIETDLMRMDWRPEEVSESSRRRRALSEFWGRPHVSGLSRAES